MLFCRWHFSFAAETVTAPVLQSREINYRNTHKTQQNHTLENKQIPKSQQKMFNRENKGGRGGRAGTKEHIRLLKAFKSFISSIT